ncbi:MAG: hypothetical protein Q3M24_18875 [Candidatus Electrothrix aestuarii]|uniref:DUF3352 domain-containing protein n=1 Tax=Candidatus Electrothrix aestuarii TaxID=3062594 RepID=A0AAU8LU22_9BACT|nr:hypothetical protein [Candidatus Electrothrix aestuarii]
MKLTLKKTLLLFLAASLLFACDKKEKEEVQVKEVKATSEQSKPVTMLDVVPADTFFFSGGLKPAPLQKVLQWSDKNLNMLQGIDPAKMLAVAEDEQLAGRRMLSQLWLDYYAMMLSPETELPQWGIPEQAFLTSYTVGLAPVLLRVSLNDVPQFNKKIEELETKAKISTQAETVGQANFHRYPLKEADPSVDLIIGVDNERKHAVFMLDIGVDSEQTIAIALGQQKPKKTLAETGRVEALQKQYALDSSFIGYLDHQQIITALTSKEGNSIAKMMQTLSPQVQQEASVFQEFLDELQTEGCRKDFENIGKNWPQTVFGYTALALEATPSHIDSLLVIENKDQALLKGLQSIRGVLPQYVRNAGESSAIAAGIGLNVQNIAPFLTERWNTITQKEYHCSFFKEMQEDAKSQQPAALAMMTGMAQGVQGLAFSLSAVELEAAEPGASPMPKSIDALISLAVENPMNLVQMLRGLAPPLAELQLSADGTPVQLPLPLPLSFPIMAAVNGSHLTVFAGEKSQALAEGLRSETLDSSRGLMAATFDYGKYYGLVGDLIAQVPAVAAQQNDAKALLDAMKNATMRVQMNMDATERGIEMKMDMMATE